MANQYCRTLPTRPARLCGQPLRSEDYPHIKHDSAFSWEAATRAVRSLGTCSGPVERNSEPRPPAHHLGVRPMRNSDKGSPPGPAVTISNHALSDMQLEGRLGSHRRRNAYIKFRRDLLQIGRRQPRAQCPGTGQRLPQKSAWPPGQPPQPRRVGRRNPRRLWATSPGLLDVPQSGRSSPALNACNAFNVRSSAGVFSKTRWPGCSTTSLASPDATRFASSSDIDLANFVSWPRRADTTSAITDMLPTPSAVLRSSSLPSSPRSSSRATRARKVKDGSAEPIRELTGPDDLGKVVSRLERQTNSGQQRLR